MKKGGRNLAKHFRIDRDGISAGGFGKKIDFAGMDMVGLVHLNGKTIQWPKPIALLSLLPA